MIIHVYYSLNNGLAFIKAGILLTDKLSYFKQMNLFLVNLYKAL